MIDTQSSLVAVTCSLDSSLTVLLHWCTGVVKNVVSHYIHNGSSVYGCFLDASKAFDLVDHNLLFKKLFDCGLPPVVVRLLSSWYSSQECCVRWGTCLSSSFRVSKTLVAQRNRFEEQLKRLKRSHDSVEKQRCAGSQGKILCRKSSLLKQVNDLAHSLKSENFPLAVQADMFLTHNLPELMKACQEFDNVYCHPVCPEKCHASCEGIKVITRGKEVIFSVAVLDEKEEAYLRNVESLKCELVASDGSSRVRGTAKRINQNIYNISYRPQVTGKHQLHILIQDHPIFNSPFTVTVLPDLSTPAGTIRDLKGPWGIAVLERGKIVVAQLGNECISSIDSKGERKSFGTLGS